MRAKIWLITFAYFLPCGYYVCSYHDCDYLNYQVGCIHAHLIIVQSVYSKIHMITKHNFVLGLRPSMNFLLEHAAKSLTPKGMQGNSDHAHSVYRHRKSRITSPQMLINFVVDLKIGIPCPSDCYDNCGEPKATPRFYLLRDKAMVRKFIVSQAKLSLL